MDLGTSGLILQAQSREEILADKIIAFAFRENRLKNRDLWDIAWLVQQGIELPAHLIPLKVRDHQRSDAEFIGLVESRLAELQAKPEMKQDFLREMQRFLPSTTVRSTLENPGYWTYLNQVLGDTASLAIKAMK